MIGDSLTCLIVGETPATQFLAWRLSLSNAFIILVSSNISSDGLVSWKSSKLGSNFYRPNEFAKEYQELEAKLVDDDGKPKYEIDVMILSCLSFPSLARYCDLLSKYSNKNTVILVNSNYGVELESRVLESFFNSSSCVLSVLCDVEGRQLSSGSFALVNDCCRFYFGLTYASKQFNKTTSKHDTLMINLQRVQDVFEDERSTLNAMLTQLEHTKVDEVVKFAPESSCDMALKVWEHVIPRISLNVISIVFEQFDYDKLLENSSSHFIFQDLVKELISICYAQCGEVNEKYMKAGFGKLCKDTNQQQSQIDFSKVVEETKSRKRQMDRSTINEYPEFLTLSFEAYCFYHHLEFPAHILLSQPMFLARKFDINYSSLNFLFGFYSRLLTISGFNIEGGPSEINTPTLLLGIRTQLASASDQTLVATNGHITEKNGTRINPDPQTKRMASKLRSKFLRRGYRAFNPTSGLVDEESNDSAENSSKFATDLETSVASFEARDVTQATGNIAFWCDNSFDHADSDQDDGNDAGSMVDELIKLPNFRKRDFSTNSLQLYRDTAAPFEQEIRNDPFSMSRYYFDAYRLGDPRTFLSLNERAPRPGNPWSMQKRRTAHSDLKSNTTIPDLDLHEHLSLLRRVNMGGILSVTTSRYGHVDSTQKIFDNWTKGVGYLRSQTLQSDQHPHSLPLQRPETNPLQLSYPQKPSPPAE